MHARIPAYCRGNESYRDTGTMNLN